MGATEKDNSLKPNTVLVPNLSEKFSENQLAEACVGFGQVNSIEIQPEKTRTLAEFDSTQADNTCAEYYSNSDFFLSGSEAQMRHTSHPIVSNGGSEMDYHAPNTILVVTIINVVYPVTPLVIAKVFAGHDLPEKIILFDRSNVIQGLVQMSSLQIAIDAKNDLSSHNIYNGCNYLTIQYSDLSYLHVENNNQSSWDLRKGGIVELEAAFSTRSNIDRNVSEVNDRQSSFSKGGAFDESSPTYVMITNVNREHVKNDELAALFAIYTNVVYVRILPSSMGGALVFVQSQKQSRIAIRYLNGLTLYGTPMNLSVVKSQDIPELSPEIQLKYPSTYYQANMPFYGRHRNPKDNRLYAPSQNLYFSNMPPGTDEEIITSFVANITSVNSIRFLDEPHHVAIVSVEDSDKALKVVCKKHAKLIGRPGNQRPLRIAFGHSSNPKALGF